MGHTLLCVLQLFLLNSLLYGQDEGGVTTLEIPTFTLFEGDFVTLRCKHHDPGNQMKATFFKYGSAVKLDTNHQSHPGGVLVIDPVSASDEGSYRCKFDDGEQSEAKNLKVEARRRSVTLTAETTVIPTRGAVTLTCSVEDPPAGLTYEWFKRMADPAETSFLQNQKSYKLVISKGGEYSCRGRSYEPDFFTTESDAVTVQETVDKATISPPPNWPQLFSGESITLRCDIKGDEYSQWTYYWRKSSSNTLPGDKQHIISSATESDSGDYRCKGRRDYSVTGWSTAITLTVSSEKPKAELEADSRDVPVGGRVTLTCSVRSSSGWKYFLYRGEKTSEPRTSKDAVFDSYGQISVSQGGLYWCRGGRGREPLYYTQYSDSVIIHETVSNRAVVTVEPSWTPIFTGETVTVRCEIERGRRTKWTYEWKPDKLNSLTHSEYRVIRADYSDREEYQCKGRRNYYSSTEWSDVTRLDVLNKPKAELEADSRDVPVGGRVTLTCSVRSSSGWKFFWYRGEKTSKPLTSEGAVFLSTERIRVSQGGLYWCRGRRGEPLYYTEYSDSVPIKENVANRAVVTLQPNWSEIYRGETITLSCEIKDGGNTEWEYEWRKNSIKLLRKKENLIGFVSYKSDRGAYSCRGRMRSSQSATDWSDPITLTVSDKPKAVLTVSPSWPSPGDSVTLSCSVEHPSAGWRFSWYKAVPKAADGSYSYELLPDSTTGTEPDSYSVHGQTHTAGYVCRAARGDPVYHTDDSEPQFVWSGDSRPSASLSVSPDRVQHFNRESLSLSCEGNSTEWRVRSVTDHRYLSDCSGWGTMTGSTCNINIIWSGDTGVYWCESGSGEFSNAVNITAQSGNVILVSPVRPVTEGNSVSLSCRLKGQKTVSTVFFYRNDKLIQNDSRRELNISAVSKSDEGFYKCGHSREDSPQSWMSVREGSSREGSTLPVSLIAGLLCGVALVVIILLLLFRCRRTKDFIFSRTSRSESTNQGSATGHMVDQNEAQHNEYSSPSSAANESREVTYSMLELKSTGKKARQHKPEERAIYSDVKVRNADDNLMYAQVNCLNTGKAKKHKGKSAADDTVYSEVKPGRSLGL